MKVGFIQQANSHDSKDNLEHALAQIELAKQRGDAHIGAKPVSKEPFQKELGREQNIEKKKEI